MKKENGKGRKIETRQNWSHKTKCNKLPVFIFFFHPFNAIVLGYIVGYYYYYCCCCYCEENDPGNKRKFLPLKHSLLLMFHGGMFLISDAVLGDACIANGFLRGLVEKS